MLGEVLISIGALFFAILLTVMYFIKAKKTSVSNIFYKIALILISINIISEISSVFALYFLQDIPIIGEILSRIDGVITITWITVIGCYIVTIGESYSGKRLRDYIKDDKRIKNLLILYVVIMIVYFFIKYENIISFNYAYVSGPALYYIYFVGVIIVLISIAIIIKNKSNLTIGKRIPIIIAAVETVLSMIFQLMFPYMLVITGSFVFKLYLLYFMFENPDLYLIEELAKSKKKAEDSNRAKTEFLSNMSHEIRTPMNAIMGFSETILNEKRINLENSKKDVEHIYIAATNLLEIMNNILDISRIETGEEKIENKEYGLGSIVLELTSIIEARINNSKVKFVTSVDENIPSKLLGDKTKIFQILLNILSNSVKYTEVGKIQLSVKCDISKDNALLHFKISDTGFGIKKEDYDKLFEKFSRLDNATKNEIEGTGLGLVITKKLVNLLNGKIWFESEYGAGTTFYVDINQKIVDNSKIGDILTTKSLSDEHVYIDCSNYKVLIVDDNKLNLKVAEKLLTPYKFSITTLNGGRECVDNIKEGNEYDLIFLDHMMPEMDGIEVLHILKKLNGYNIPPIVALTANAITGMREMYLNEGFDEYLPKPISISDLDKLINKYFNKNGRNLNNGK